MSDGRSALSQLEQTEDFVTRHIGPRDTDVGTMLETVGVDSLDQLIEQAVPTGLQSEAPLDLPPGRREEDVLGALDEGERIAAILLTHTHIDHSPGAAALKAATGAKTYAFGPHGAGMSRMMIDLAASGADLGGGEGADPEQPWHVSHTLPRRCRPRRDPLRGAARPRARR